MGCYDYNQTREALSGDALVTNFWNLRIPTGAKAVGALPQKIQLRVKSVTLPDRSVAEAVDLVLNNHHIKVNKGVNLSGEFNVTIVEGLDAETLAYFEKWMNARFNIDSSGNPLGKAQLTSELKCDWFLDLLAPTGDVVKTYMFRGAMPKTIGSQELGQEPDGAVFEVPLTIDYDVLAPIKN